MNKGKWFAFTSVVIMVIAFIALVLSIVYSEPPWTMEIGEPQIAGLTDSHPTAAVKAADPRPEISTYVNLDSEIVVKLDLIAERLKLLEAIIPARDVDNDKLVAILLAAKERYEADGYMVEGFESEGYLIKMIYSTQLTKEQEAHNERRREREWDDPDPGYYRT